MPCEIDHVKKIQVGPVVVCENMRRIHVKFLTMFNVGLIDLILLVFSSLVGIVFSNVAKKEPFLENWVA